MVKRCLFCGQYFTPDRRVKDRQKSCGRPECWKARKKKAQEAWTERNPGYFQGRYPYVKAWRQGRKMIQDKIPPKNPYVELVIRMGPLRGHPMSLLSSKKFVHNNSNGLAISALFTAHLSSRLLPRSFHMVGESLTYGESAP